MLHRLARDLGRTVRELTRELSTAEYIEWIAFYVLEAEETEKASREAARRRRR